MVGGVLQTTCCVPTSCSDVNPPTCPLTLMNISFTARTTGGSGPLAVGPTNIFNGNWDGVSFVSNQGCYGCSSGFSGSLGGTSSQDVIDSYHTFNFTFDIVQGSKIQGSGSYYRPGTAILLGAVDDCRFTYNARWRALSGLNGYRYTTCDQSFVPDTTVCVGGDDCNGFATGDCCSLGAGILPINVPGPDQTWSVIGGTNGWGAAGSNYLTFSWAGAALVTASIRIVWLASSTARGPWRITAGPTSFKIESSLGDVYTWTAPNSLSSFIRAIGADPTSGTNPYLRIRTNGVGYTLLATNILPGDVRMQGEFDYPDPFAVQCNPSNNLTSGIYFPIVYFGDETFTGWPGGFVIGTGGASSGFLPNQAGLLQWFSLPRYPKHIAPIPVTSSIGCFGYPSTSGSPPRPVFYNWVFTSTAGQWNSTPGASVVTEPKIPNSATISTITVTETYSSCGQEPFDLGGCISETVFPHCSCFAQDCEVCGGVLVPDVPFDPFNPCGTCTSLYPGTNFYGGSSCGCGNPIPCAGSTRTIEIIENTVVNFECGGLTQTLTGSCTFS